MQDIPPIQIPAELLPSDGRFGSGPSKVRIDALRRLAETGSTFLGTSHRRPPVQSVVGRIRAGLAELFSLPAGYEVLAGNGGATAFWDAASCSLIETCSQHLVFGEFSARFAAVTQQAPHLQSPDLIESPPGTHPEPRANPEVDTYALTHNETSTGVMAPVRRPSSQGLVVVDATSAAGGLMVDPTQFDVYYFSPQKGFGSEGGIWLAACSPAAIERIGRLDRSRRWVPASLDLAIALEHSRLNQTYNTPALSSLWLLADQIEWFLASGGLDWASQRSRRSSEIVYDWAERTSFTTPFVSDPAARSRVVATIDLEGVSAEVLGAVLRANRIVDIESYRKLGRNQIRIGMFPAVDPPDIEALTTCIDYVAERL